MNRHKILFFAIVLLFVFFFGFLATYSRSKITNPSINIVQEPISTAPVRDTTSLPVNDTAGVSQFDSLVSLDLHSRTTFSDGLSVALQEINDSRCPSGVQCVWAGELTAVLELSNGTIVTTKEIRLGALTAKSIIVDGYTFTLNSATTQNIRFVVSKN